MTGGLTYRDFCPLDVAVGGWQPAQQGAKEAFLMRNAPDREFAVTVCLDGVPVACLGCSGEPPGGSVGYIWAMLSPALTGALFVSFHKQVGRLEAAMFTVFKRLYFTVDAEFPQGHRWAVLLGYKATASVWVGNREHRIYDKGVPGG